MTKNLNIFVAGAIDGDVEEFYTRIMEIEKKTNTTCDWVLCVGHVGTWVSPAHMPGVSRKKRDSKNSDFNEYFKGNKTINHQTVFVTGSQDNHRWLKRLTTDKNNLEIIPNLHWLRNGNFTLIGNSELEIKVVGLGNSYSPKTYNNIYTTDRIKHFKRSEVNRACTVGKVDIFMSHTAPKGVTLEGRTTMSEGVDKIIFATQPRLVVHNGLNVSAKYKFLGINCISVKMKEIVPVAITDYSISIGESFYN